MIPPCSPSERTVPELDDVSDSFSTFSLENNNESKDFPSSVCIVETKAPLPLPAKEFNSKITLSSEVEAEHLLTDICKARSGLKESATKFDKDITATFYDIANDEGSEVIFNMELVSKNIQGHPDIVWKSILDDPESIRDGCLRK